MNQVFYGDDAPLRPDFGLSALLTEDELTAIRESACDDEDEE